MPFVPRLPTFATDVVWYKYDPVGDAWSIQDPITGQIYTPLRNQDDEAGGLLYFMYPKGSDLLHDTYDYNASGKSDVLFPEYPSASGSLRGYKVREVLPRWLGFPNEHLMVALQRLTAAEVNEATGGLPPGTYMVEGDWTVITQTSDAGAVDWSPLAVAESDVNITGLQGGTAGAPGRFSQQIDCSGLAIAVPSAATIIGVEQLVTVEHVANAGTGTAGFSTATMMLQASVSDLTGDRQDHLVGYPMGSEELRTYGSPTDLWGGGWTAAKLNAADPRFYFIAEYWNNSSDRDDTAVVNIGKLRVWFSI